DRSCLPRAERQPGPRGVLPVVVDVDDLPSGPVEDGRADRGTQAASAIQPDLTYWHLGGAALDLPERDVHRSVQMTGLPFIRPPDVQDHQAGPIPFGGEPGKVGDPIAGEAAVEGKRLRLAAGGTGYAVDADPGQMELRISHLILAFADQ